LIQGNTVLESSLHTNISEHLNSEIGLGTITNVASAKQWLRGSFLFQRIRKNPQHYALGKGDSQTWEERVDDLVMQSIDKLQETQLIEVGAEGRGTDKLSSTEYGDIMSKVGFRRFFCPFEANFSPALHSPVNCPSMCATQIITYSSNLQMSLMLALPQHPTMRELVSMRSQALQLLILMVI